MVFVKPNYLHILSVSIFLSFSAVAEENEDALTLWMDASQPVAGLEAVAELFTADKGVKVVIESPDRIPTRFQKLSAVGEGPDIVFWNHQYLEDWAKAKLISPVAPGQKLVDQTDNFWLAAKYNNQTYAYPYAVSGTLLMANKSLMSADPKTFDELVFETSGIGSAEHSILWDYSNPYFSYSLALAEGGYIFSTAEGKWAPDQVGLAEPGTVKALSKLRSWLDMSGLPRSVDYNTADRLFVEGKSASIINGYWAWQRYQQEGIELIPLDFPIVETKPAKSLLLVDIAAINSSSDKKLLAAQFLEFYLLSEQGQKLMHEAQDSGMPVNLKLQQELSAQNQSLAKIYSIWRQGEIIPNVSATALFWNHSNRAFKQALKQDLNPKQTLVQAQQSYLTALEKSAAPVKPE